MCFFYEATVLACLCIESSVLLSKIILFVNAIFIFKFDNGHLWHELVSLILGVLLFFWQLIDILSSKSKISSQDFDALVCLFLFNRTSLFY